MLSLRTSKIFFAFVLIILIILLYGPMLQSCSKSMDSIVVAYSPFETTGLVWVAEDQNYFNSNRISITFRKYDTGAGALNGILNGEADIVVGTTEFPFVIKAFEKADIKIIGSIAKSEIIYLVGRRDRGIEEVSDLRGKVIGTTHGTIAEFYLGRFLELNGMSIEDVALVDLKTPTEWTKAVVNGDIDAVVTAQPYANSAKELLGPNAILWCVQSGQLLYSNIIAKDEWITKNTNLVKSFLRSLSQSEEYIINNSSKAKNSIQQHLDLDISYMDIVWTQNQFGLSLEQSLVFAMEDEARWMIANNLINQEQIPYFLDFIDESALGAIRPEAVNIIR